MTLFRFFRLVQSLLYILECSIFAYAILSWFSPRFSLYMWLDTLLTPILRPFRRLNDWLLRQFRLPLDFSCWFAILALQLANSVWWRLYLILRTLRGR